MALGLIWREGQVFGLGLGPESRKILFPRFQIVVSSFQRRVARSEARPLREEALILSPVRRLSLSEALRSASAA